MTRPLIYRGCGCPNDRTHHASCASAPVDPRSRPSASVVAEIEAASWAVGHAPRSGAIVIRKRPRRLCDVPGCGRRHSSKGKCARHYNLARQIGEAAARLVPATFTRRCSSCETPIGAANHSGTCRPCRVYAKRHGHGTTT